MPDPGTSTQPRAAYPTCSLRLCSTIAPSSKLVVLLAGRILPSVQLQAPVSCLISAVSQCTERVPHQDAPELVARNALRAVQPRVVIEGREAFVVAAVATESKTLFCRSKAIFNNEF